MSYTTHGHHIQGTPTAGAKPERVARCGGPGLCRMCSLESSAAQRQIQGIPFSTPDEGENNTRKARQLVLDHITSKGYTRGHTTFEIGEVYVVWFTYILGAWKALVSTTLPDGRYYEVTYNKEKAEAYVDEYYKADNVVVPDPR